MSLPEQPDPRGVRIAGHEPSAQMSVAEARKQLYALLSEHVHDSHGRQISTIVAAACQKLFTKHRNPLNPVLELNGAVIDAYSCKVSGIHSALGGLKLGKSATFPELIKLDPDFFFSECERIMEEKRVRSAPKESAQVLPNARAEILAAIDCAMRETKHKNVKRQSSTR